MIDGEIRTAILAARGGMKPFTEPDCEIVNRARVSGDLDEIDDWVRKHGRIVEIPASHSHALGLPRWQKPPWSDPSLWYVVPVAALMV